jgi:acetylglutamate kinase
LTHDRQGNILNTNADTIASETAQALAKYFDVTLVFCFEKKGVLLDENDDNSIIPELDKKSFAELTATGAIQGGMLPKLENAFESIDNGVKEVVITQASAILGSGGTVVK